MIDLMLLFHILFVSFEVLSMLTKITIKIKIKAKQNKPLKLAKAKEKMEQKLKELTNEMNKNLP